MRSCTSGLLVGLGEAADSVGNNDNQIFKINPGCRSNGA